VGRRGACDAPLVEADPRRAGRAPEFDRTPAEDAPPLRRIASVAVIVRRAPADGRMEDAMKRLVEMLALGVGATALIAASLPAAAGGSAPSASAISKIQLASLTKAGVQADAACTNPTLSPDGTRVLFLSSATTFGGTGDVNHVYMKHLATGGLMRISANVAKVPANGDTWEKAVFSPDGTKVLFTSFATNLVGGDTNGVSDIFEKTLATGGVKRLSTNSTGQQANGGSREARYSPDGKKIVFTSDATNLIAADSNGQPDLFVKDLATGKVQRVSLTYVGRQINDAATNPSFSPDGKKITFVSWATNLLAGDTNGAPDIFVRDLVTGDVARANVSRTGAQSNGWDDFPGLFRANGNEVVFPSNGTNLVGADTNGNADIFLKNLTTKAVRRLSTTTAGQQFPTSSMSPAIDSAGNRLAFVVQAAPPSAHDTPSFAPGGDVYVKNLTTDVASVVSTSLAGVKGNAVSSDPDVSADGKLVAFSSASTNLVAGDGNGQTDIFVVTLK